MSKKEFEILYRINYPRLKTYARKFVDDTTAEDLLQDVFLNFWNNKRSSGINNPESYLFISLRNACYNHLKKTVLQNKVFNMNADHQGEYLYHLDYQQEADLKSLKEQLEQELKEKLEHLPPKCKEVFLLSRFSGLKNREVALKLGISEKVVEKHISRAFKILRKHFTGKNKLV
jgi:RNA polymerase sigma-70 factor (family 1)